MQDWLNHVYFGNPVNSYIWAIGYFAAACLILFIIKTGVLKRLRPLIEKSESRVDDFVLVSTERMVMPLLYFGAFYFAAKYLVLAVPVERALFTIGIVILTFFVARFLSELLTFLIREVWLKKEQAQDRENNLKILMPIVRVLTWGLALVFLLDNLGFRVSAVITGLGIGGIAIAMASQALLMDFFSYLAIVLDKPFEIGDFIILSDGFMGSIEHLGIKTTRIRSLSGEQIIIPNSHLTSNRVRNYKRMQERRVQFTLGVTYNTTPEKLEKAVSIVKDLIAAEYGVRLDRVHFSRFADFNLVIEVVYWVLSPDYNLYMDVQQKLNFAIQRAFAGEGIAFAFPTQTVYLNNQNSSTQQQP